MTLSLFTFTRQACWSLYIGVSDTSVTIVNLIIWELVNIGIICYYEGKEKIMRQDVNIGLSIYVEPVNHPDIWLAVEDVKTAIGDAMTPEMAASINALIIQSYSEGHAATRASMLDRWYGQGCYHLEPDV